jgi:hypothetical protein
MPRSRNAARASPRDTSASSSSNLGPVTEPVGKPPHRPNGSGDPSPGFYEAEGRCPGKKDTPSMRPEGRENLFRCRRPPQEGLDQLVSQPPSKTGPTVSRPFRPHRVVKLATQGIGLRPQPWAPFSRPVGPDGPTTRVMGLSIDQTTDPNRRRSPCFANLERWSAAGTICMNEISREPVRRMSRQP